MENIELVVLVDEQDNELGQMEKLQAHREAKLHRAFSIFVFNEAGQLLMQKRALAKYHSPGLWTNTCCSHPKPNESNLEAATRRLKEEMGFECELQYQFNFIYKAELDQGLIEHELDHVFFGTYTGDINPNSNEVMEFKYMGVQEILLDIECNPNNYTVWFKIIFDRVIGLKKKGSLSC